MTDTSPPWLDVETSCAVELGLALALAQQTRSGHNQDTRWARHVAVRGRDRGSAATDRDRQRLPCWRPLPVAGGDRDVMVAVRARGRRAADRRRAIAVVVEMQSGRE